MYVFTLEIYLLAAHSQDFSALGPSGPAPSARTLIRTPCSDSLAAFLSREAGRDGGNHEQAVLVRCQRACSAHSEFCWTQWFILERTL